MSPHCFRHGHQQLLSSQLLSYQATRFSAQAEAHILTCTCCALLRNACSGVPVPGTAYVAGLLISDMCPSEISEVRLLPNSGCGVNGSAKAHKRGIAHRY